MNKPCEAQVHFIAWPANYLQRIPKAYFHCFKIEIELALVRMLLSICQVHIRVSAKGNTSYTPSWSRITTDCPTKSHLPSRQIPHFSVLYRPSNNGKPMPAYFGHAALTIKMELMGRLIPTRCFVRRSSTILLKGDMQNDTTYFGVAKTLAVKHKQRHELFEPFLALGFAIRIFITGGPNS